MNENLLWLEPLEDPPAACSLPSARSAAHQVAQPGQQIVPQIANLGNKFANLGNKLFH